MAKIGIYGGSFNPPHLGHVLAAQECRDRLGLDRVLLIPAAIPPHKQLADGSPDAETRLELTRLAFAGLDRVEVSDVELRRDGPSYSVDTLRQLREVYPADELLLLMGTDMFLKFEQWREPAAICAMAGIVCFYRSEKNDALAQAVEQQAESIRQSYGCSVYLLDNASRDISSTQVRRLLFFRCGAQELPRAVYDQICRDGLYGVGGDYRNLPFEQLERISLSLLKPSRTAHVLGCCETAAKLAEQYGADVTAAARAGILHDVTKALTGAQQLQLCQALSVPLTPLEREQPKLLHAKTGAAVAKQIFGESDAVTSAICWHTTGRENMTTLEKIIYIADYMEPNRDFPGVEQLRETVWRNLDEAVLLGIEMTLAMLAEKKRVQAPDSILARDFLLRERTNHETIWQQKECGAHKDTQCP